MTAGEAEQVPGIVGRWVAVQVPGIVGRWVAVKVEDISIGDDLPLCAVNWFDIYDKLILLPEGFGE